MKSLSIRQARRVALGAQGFTNNRPVGRVDRRHLRKCMYNMEVVQLDAVPVVIRTQYMPFFSRLGPYKKDLFDEVAYEEDEWFELWAHEASIAPVEIEPYFRFNKVLAKAGATWKGLHQLATNDPTYIQKVLKEVSHRGPLEAKDLSDPQPRESNGWGHRSKGQLALNWLFRIGEVGIRRGPNFEKRFDLIDRIIPSDILNLPTPDLRGSIKNLMLRSSKAYGVATSSDLVDYFRLPKKEAREAIRELVENKDIEVVRVEKWKEEAYMAKSAVTPRSIDICSLVSPFDPLAWNRSRLLRLFDFRYKIEIYKPEAKRQFGYYVMPLVVGECLVGRFDLKNLHEQKTLHVKGSYGEARIDKEEISRRAYEELSTLARFLGADKIRIEKNGNLADSLRKH